MVEATEQIQNPVLPESPVPDVQAQPPESQTLEPEHPAQDEAALTAEITQLWQIHSDYKTSIKHQSEGLRTLRAELGKKLSDMKRILARPGRGGEWSGWLKQRRISRATADRLVIRYERSLNPDGNCLIEAISEPTEAEIQSLFDKIAPKLRRVLRTPASAYRFLDLLASSIDGLDRRNTEEGFLIVKPRQEAAPAPTELQRGSTSLVAAAPADRNAESTWTSMEL